MVTQAHTKKKNDHVRSKTQQSKANSTTNHHQTAIYSSSRDDQATTTLQTKNSGPLKTERTATTVGPQRDLQDAASQKDVAQSAIIAGQTTRQDFHSKTAGCELPQTMPPAR